MVMMPIFYVLWFTHIVVLFLSLSPSVSYFVSFFASFLFISGTFALLKRFFSEILHTLYLWYFSYSSHIQILHTLYFSAVLICRFCQKDCLLYLHLMCNKWRPNVKSYPPIFLYGAIIMVTPKAIKVGMCQHKWDMSTEHKICCKLI